MGLSFSSLTTSSVKECDVPFGTSSHMADPGLQELLMGTNLPASRAFWIHLESLIHGAHSMPSLLVQIGSASLSGEQRDTPLFGVLGKCSCDCTKAEKKLGIKSEPIELNSLERRMKHSTSAEGPLYVEKSEGMLVLTAKGLTSFQVTFLDLKTLAEFPTRKGTEYFVEEIKVLPGIFSPPKTYDEQSTWIQMPPEETFHPFGPGIGFGSSPPLKVITAIKVEQTFPSLTDHQTSKPSLMPSSRHERNDPKMDK
ncbi:PREDICTED: uncharacterized protein LOC106537560 [Thamnophis sirtalis]|uniref:Uncharacterized protein LOC106537560 n=1 Tax=Thamnophis sirtalis TaxID=35019 RepID=A0A6I9X743_9SAUR|nr:PREDICTED: uncharacterized protein LOC106537560 [Thamnophis sirtalis]